MSNKALFLDYKNYYKYHKKQYSDVLSDLGYLEFVHDKLQKEIEDIDVGIDPQLEAKVNTNTQNISDLDTKVEDIEADTVTLGETSTTAYRGDRGKTAYDHSQETSGNPHNVTASDVGLGNVDDTSDLDKPISTATQGALDDKASDSDLTNHTSNQSNPHSVTKTQVGLSNVDNTSDLNKPISTATQNALDDKADDLDLTNHIDDTNNPHAVNKSDVGLGNVPNTDFTSDVNANTAKRSYPLVDENKLTGIEAGAQVNVKTDWAETDPNSDKFLENKPDQVISNIYNQNSNDEVVVNSTNKISIIQATTGATDLPSLNLNDSFIGKLFGTFDNSNQDSTVSFKFIIGNRAYDMAIDVGASTNILPVSIDYTINFPIDKEAHFTGVVRIGADSAVIDIQLPTPNIISGFNYMLEAELELGELKSKSSYLHRKYN